MRESNVRLIITGAKGQLGSSIIESLKKNYSILAFGKNDLNIEKDHQFQNLKICEGKKYYLINAAAYTDVEGAEKDRESALSINAYSMKSITNFCYKKNIKLIHFSTDYVFDGNKTSPYTDQDTPNPINAYGHSKLTGEKIIKKSKCSHIIIRTSWLFSGYRNNFLNTIVKKLLNEEPLNIVKDQVGSPTSCADLASALNRLIRFDIKNNLTNKTIHFAGRDILDWHAFACLIRNRLILQTGKNFNLINSTLTKDLKFQALRPKYSSLKTSDIFFNINVDRKSLNEYIDDALNSISEPN